MSKTLLRICCYRNETHVASGRSIEAVGAAHSTHPDYPSPLEPLFVAEVAHAVADMPRQEADELVLTLIERYEDRPQYLRKNWGLGCVGVASPPPHTPTSPDLLRKYT